MTDLEKLLSIIEDKVKYERNDVEVSYRKNYPNVHTIISVENSENPHLGYGGFWSDWLFDNEGNFLAVGHWE